MCICYSFIVGFVYKGIEWFVVVRVVVEELSKFIFLFIGEYMNEGGWEICFFYFGLDVYFKI